MVVGFFDESGHSGDTDFVSIAAFAGEVEMWEDLEGRWSAALSESGAPFLHMREFAHSTGPYKGWSEAERKRFLGACVRAIKASGLTAIGAAVAVSDFRALTSAEQRMFRDPFFVCAQEVVRAVGIRSDREPDGVKCRMIFSQQDELQGMMKKLWDGLLLSSDIRERMGELEFADMRGSPGLQAADLLAYEMRHFYHRRAKDPHAATRWAFKEIVTHQYDVLGARMLKYLPRWYLELQATGAFEEGMATLLQQPGKYFPLLSELHPQV